MILKSNNNLIRLRAETNTIRLIASDKVQAYLNQLDKLYDISFEKSFDMLRSMGNNIITNNQDLINQQNEELQTIGSMINDVHEQLVREIKIELDEI